MVVETPNSLSKEGVTTAQQNMGKNTVAYSLHSLLLSSQFINIIDINSV